MRRILKNSWILEVKRFLLMLFILALMGLIMDFGFAGSWGLSPETLMAAWASIISSFIVSYWVTVLIIKK